MKEKQVMKAVLLASILLTGCANSSVDKILTETKTRKIEVVSCPTTMIKVCNGPDKKTIALYEKVYCSCQSRRNVEQALMRNQ